MRCSFLIPVLTFSEEINSKLVKTFVIIELFTTSCNILPDAKKYF